MSAAGLLKAVAGGVLKYGLRLLAGGLPLGEVLVEVAGDAWERWRRDGPESERRADLQNLAESTPEETRRRSSLTTSPDRATS